MAPCASGDATDGRRLGDGGVGHPHRRVHVRARLLLQKKEEPVSSRLLLRALLHGAFYA
jgi:hypothetical protein